MYHDRTIIGIGLAFLRAPCIRLSLACLAAVALGGCAFQRSTRHQVGAPGSQSRGDASPEHPDYNASLVNVRPLEDAMHGKVGPLSEIPAVYSIRIDITNKRSISSPRRPTKPFPATPPVVPGEVELGKIHRRSVIDVSADFELSDAIVMLDGARAPGGVVTRALDGLRITLEAVRPRAHTLRILTAAGNTAIARISFESRR